MLTGCREKKEYRCDLCNSREFSVRRSLEHFLSIERTGFNVVSCARCGLASIYPLPDEHKLAEVYSGYAVKKDRIEVEKARLKKIYPHKINKFIDYANGRKLLDVGAGLGTFVYAARKAGFDAVGIEYEKSQCETARKLWDIELVNGKIECLYKTMGTFDVINLHHVLEHVVSPRQIMAIIYEMLNADGIACIEVPNQFFNINDKVRHFFTMETGPKRILLDHLYFFSVRTLKRYMRDKFKILEVNQFIKGDSASFKWYEWPKEIYRATLEKLDIGAGGFIEIYVRKN